MEVCQGYITTPISSSFLLLIHHLSTTPLVSCLLVSFQTPHKHINNGSYQADRPQVHRWQGPPQAAYVYTSFTMEARSIRTRLCTRPATWVEEARWTIVGVGRQYVMICRIQLTRQSLPRPLASSPAPRRPPPTSRPLVASRSPTVTGPVLSPSVRSGATVRHLPFYLYSCATAHPTRLYGRQKLTCNREVDRAPHPQAPLPALGP